MIKKILSLLLALALVLPLAACGNTGNSDGPVDITLTMWDEVQLPTIQANIDKFNAANEGKINATIELVPWADYWTKLDASLTTSECPDVMWMNPYLPKYADGKVVLPIDDYIKNDNLDMSQYVEARVNAFNYNGSQYALPKGLDAVYVALNTEIFTRYGVELPKDGWTWDDMRAIADKLRDAIAAAGGKEYPIVMELDGQPSWLNFVVQNGSANLYVSENRVGAGETAYIDAISQLRNLMVNGEMAPYTVLSETKGTDLFVSGQSAIVFIGSWKASVLNDSNLGKAGNIQLIQMPSMAKNNYSVLGGLGYCIAANSKHPDEAWQLVKWLTNEDSLRYEAQCGIDFPANIAAQDAYVSSFKNINAQVISDASVTGFAFQSNGNFEWTSTINDAVALVLAGEKDPSYLKEAGTAAQKIIDEAFGK